MTENTFDYFVKNGMVQFRKYIKDAAQSGKKIDDSFFAEGLTESLRNMDIRDFFSRTAMTDELRELIRQVLERVYGIGGEGAILLDTVMGGGKTFSLLLISNIFRDRGLAMQQDEIRNIVYNLSRNSIPEVEVVIVDGRELNDKLGFNDQPEVKAFFANGTPTSVENEFKRRGKPVVVVIDEILEYFSKRGNTFNQDLPYLRALVEGAQRTTTSLVIVTIPSDPADMEKYDKLQKMFRSLNRTARIMRTAGDVKSLREIVIKQIFEDIKPVAKQAAINYVKEHSDVLKEEDVEGSYPFHPEILEVFGRKLSEFPNYKKTRGALILLANFCADIQRKVDSGFKFDTPLITLGDLDLEVKKEDLTSVNIYNIRNLENVYDKDIKTWKPGSFERKILTTIYLYSLNYNKNRRGATSKQISMALIYRAEEDVENKLSSLITQTTYLDYDKATRKYLFTGEPNLISVVNKRAESVNENDAWSQIKSVLEGLFQDREINLIESSYDEYSDGYLNVMIIPYNRMERYETDLTKLWEDLKIDSNFENGTVVVYPSEVISEMEKEAKKFVAISEYREEASKEHDKELMDKIDDLKTQIENNLSMRVVAAYSNVMFRQVGTGSVVSEKFSAKSNIKDSYLNEFKNCLVNAQKVYFEKDVDKCNCNEFFRRLLGERVEMENRIAYRDIQSGTALPFLTTKAFELALREAVKSGYIGISDASTQNEEFNQEAAEIVIGKEPSWITGGYILEPEYAKRILISRKEGTKTQPTVEPPVGNQVETASSQVKVQHTIASPLLSLNNNDLKENLKRYIGELINIYSTTGNNFTIEFHIISNGEAIIVTDSSKGFDLKTLVDYLSRLSSNLQAKVVAKNLDDETLKTLKLEWGNDG